MTTRKFHEIENKTERLKSQLIELNVEIENHPEKFPHANPLETDRVLRGGGRRLAELENERESTHRKLKVLDDERTQQASSNPKRPGYGELEEDVWDLLKSSMADHSAEAPQDARIGLADTPSCAFFGIIGLTTFSSFRSIPVDANHSYTSFTVRTLPF